MIGGKSAPAFQQQGIKTDIFTEGNEGQNLEDSDVVNQTFVGRPLFAPVENLRPERKTF